MKFQLCESGYPTNLGNSDADTCSNLYKDPINLLNPGSCSWAGVFPNPGDFNLTPGNNCDATGNGYVTSDCFNLKIYIPFIGKLQIFHMTMPWQWTCHGIGSGAKSPNCFVFNPSMFFRQDGSCGDGDGKTFADASLIMDRCEKGYSIDLKVEYKDNKNQITWSCK